MTLSPLHSTVSCDDGEDGVELSSENDGIATSRSVCADAEMRRLTLPFQSNFVLSLSSPSLSCPADKQILYSPACVSWTLILNQAQASPLMLV